MCLLKVVLPAGCKLLYILTKYCYPTPPILITLHVSYFHKLKLNHFPGKFQESSRIKIWFSSKSLKKRQKTIHLLRQVADTVDEEGKSKRSVDPASAGRQKRNLETGKRSFDKLRERLKNCKVQLEINYNIN